MSIKSLYTHIIPKKEKPLYTQSIYRPS
jgi:hypothetical protein